MFYGSAFILKGYIMKITAVIVAGGKGTRMGADKNKVFLKIFGREVLYYTISAFEKNDKIDDIIVVTGKNDIEECQILVDKYDIKKVSYITEGGATRQESVMNGLKKAEGDIVLIHDGARALVTDDEINNSVADCIKFGAAALGDIGKHFPDTDEKYKGADSRMLLREVVKKVAEKGYSVGNADVTIVAQRPKMLPYIEQMRKNVADDLNVGIDDVNIKATTTEKLGFEGRGEGISATAIVLLK